jgi:FlaA1/EpsC-like NDP-sugar epimerase
MKRLIIYGARHLDVIKLIDAINRQQPTFEVVGFVSDSPEEHGKTFMSYPVVGGKEALASWAREDNVVFVSNITSSFRNRRKIAALFGAGAVVGTGSVVLQDIPSGALAYGVPAKVKRQFREDETVG